MTPATATDRLADVEEHLLAAGHRLGAPQQLVQARRHLAWTRQWLRLRRIAATGSGDVLDRADHHLRAALALVDREVSP